MKVGVVIITYNIDGRIFILQIEAIKKYCKDSDYTIECIDNSTDANLAAAIKHHARHHEVKYTRFRSRSIDPSRSHSFAANLAYRRFMDMYNVILFLDHDCIPVNYYSVEEMLNGKVVGGVLSGSNLNYFWPGCFVISNDKVDKTLVDFSPNNSLKLDTGGELRKLKEKYGDEGCEYLEEVGCENPQMQLHKQYYFYMMIYKETFLHFLCASGWQKTEQQEERLNSLIDITIATQAENDLLLNKP